MPPKAGCTLPWDGPVSDAVATIAEARAECGDTFVIDSGADRYLFVFSPQGLKRLYQLPEHEASKGIADVKMLLRKLPEEIFQGRRMLPHELFAARPLSEYLNAFDLAISRQASRLRPGECIDLFDFARQLGHTLGLASWAGIEILDSAALANLINALDQLDGSESFVAPTRMREVAAQGKTAERAALAEAEQILARMIKRRRSPKGDLSDEIISRWQDAPEPERLTGIARDIILLHMASMSNLFAAIGWTLVHLAEHPQVLARIRARAAPDQDLASKCAMESIRIAQQSIVLRTVLSTLMIDDGARLYQASPGVTLATFLPLTNRFSDQRLDAYNPDRWQGARPELPAGVPAEAVTTFGHGAHACPARPFSIAVISRVVDRIFTQYDLEPLFHTALPRPDQIGGVARSRKPCRVMVRARAGSGLKA